MVGCDFVDDASPRLGMVNQNRAPPPRRLSTPTRPPWASTMDLTMDSPRPTPSLTLLAVAGSRFYGSNKRWVCSTDTPGPRSATEMRTALWRLEIVRSIGLSASPNLLALRIK